ncbi:MAG: hypothetical protein AAGC45_05575 [Bacteroidota bacterium]
MAIFNNRLKSEVRINLTDGYANQEQTVAASTQAPAQFQIEEGSVLWVRTGDNQVPIEEESTPFDPNNGQTLRIYYDDDNELLLRWE